VADCYAKRMEHGKGFIRIKEVRHLVLNEKGEEAAATIAGVVGFKVPEGEPPPPVIEIALRFRDWPELMRQRVVSAYLDLPRSRRSYARFIAEPCPTP